MTYKKVRAGISAMLLYSQLMLLFFVVNAALFKKADIKAVTAPLALQEMALLFILVVITFLGYYLFPIKKGRVAYVAGLGGVEILLWLITLITMSSKKILGFPEMVFVFLECLLIAACCAGVCIFSPKKENGRWMSVKIVESACVLAMFGSATVVSLRYRNEMISAKITILMFALCAVCMLLYWWCADEINHLASGLVILGQAITFICCFSMLCRKKEVADMIGTAYSAIRGKTPTHLLTWTALLLVFLLALAMLFHYFKNLQIVGKYLSVIMSCMVLLVVLSVNGIHETVADSTNVDAEDATKYAEYSLFVMKDDPAQSGADIAGYTVGYASDGYVNSMFSATQALTAKIGTNFEWKEYTYVSELADAFYAGEVDAAFFEGALKEFIDEGYEGEDGSTRVFSEDTREIETVKIEHIEEDPILPDDPYDPDNPDNPDNPDTPDDPTPTLPEGITPTPTPTLPAGVTATPTPTKRVGTPTPKPTKAPTPTTMPKKPRADKSNKDVTKEPFLVYISGIDRYGDVSVRSRSDVNLLMAVNPKTKQITVVTTPRDAYVHIPGKTTSQKDKLTHAGLYGVDYSIATLENLYGVEIDFYVRMNFSGMINIINLLGGVDAECLWEFTTYDGVYHFPKGMVHLDGATALVFARERKGIPQGDAARAKHQMEVLKAVVNKMSSPSALANYQSLIKEISKYTQTDLTVSQLTSLCTMQLADGGKWKVDSYSTSGTSSYQYCYSYKGKKLWVSLLKSDSIKQAAKKLNSTLGR